MSKKQNDYPRKFVFLIVFILCVVLAYVAGIKQGQSNQTKSNQRDQVYTQSLEKQIKSLRDELDNTKSLKVTD